MSREIPTARRPSEGWDPVLTQTEKLNFSKLTGYTNDNRRSKVMLKGLGPSLAGTTVSLIWFAAAMMAVVII